MYGDTSFKLKLCMKNLFFLFLFSLNAHSQSLSFVLPKSEYPYHEILEWRGFGALLLGKDPTEKSKKVNITLVGSQQKASWTQNFNPKGKKYYYISGENTDCVYFLDNLHLEDGKYYFSQVNSSGIVKTSSSVLTHLLTMVFKNIGDLNINDLKLIDIVNTEKALVHLFRYHNIKAHKYTEIGIFMAHSNMVSFACILGEIKEETFNDKYMGHWKYVGSTGENNYFAVRGYNKAMQKGWLVSGYNSKAELIQQSFIANSDINFEPIENRGFGITGRHYLNQPGDIESNVISHFKGNFYLSGIALVNGGRELKVLKLSNNTWIPAYSYPLKAAVAGKINSKFGVYPINEGLGIKLEPFDTKVGTIISLYSDKILFNPSRMFLKEQKSDFAFILDATKLFFAYSQLNSTIPVRFTFLEKPK
jgi:hypothetical protein